MISSDREPRIIESPVVRMLILYLQHREGMDGAERETMLSVMRAAVNLPLWIVPAG